MYEGDLKHSDQSLEDKLFKLYRLNREKTIDLSFRPPYLDLLEKFGNPHLHLPPVIHVAGTNGKGSSIALLRGVLEEAGFRVHAYTSPHLLHFNERIVLAGVPIGDADLEALIDEALALNDGGAVTFFEVTTAMAFAAFSRIEADVVLLETGLGGRLDCTNVVPSPIATLITAISCDHVEYLGNSLPEIAGEKAGIIKARSPCVIAPQTPEALDAGVMDVFEGRAEVCAAPLYEHGRDWRVEFCDGGFRLLFEGQAFVFPRPALLGAHQVCNAGGALAVLYVLRDRFGWDVDVISRALGAVAWSGRLEHIQGGRVFDMLAPDCTLWYDGGHNESAGAALAAQMEIWQVDEMRPLHLIVGMKGDKRPDDFLAPLLPFCTRLSLVDLDGVGGCVREQDLGTVLTAYPALPFSHHVSVRDALECHNDRGQRILICGSLYLAAQVA